MSYSITQESFDSLSSCWDDPPCCSGWSSVFVLPAWLKLWWQEFKPEAELYLGAVRREGQIIGVAPLQILENKASFIGSADVCDYLDFVITPGAESDFFKVVLDDLKQRGVRHLDLQCLRPESTVLTSLAGIARNREYEVVCQPEDVSVELDLPATFDEYLEILETKQRHEVKRKLRRLLEAGKVDFRIIEDSAEVNKAMDIFLKMFTESRSDKAAFLTSQKESFFRSLAGTMTGIKLLKMGILELDTRPTAMILYFDYGGSTYLYNSGYDPQYTSLSVGLMSKVLCIQECINKGKKKYDFLKGNEVYKYHLGGKEVTLSNCQITFK
ncbi:MAG: GNAT family N-acetyltransferase [Chloroflexi bacterium]|nr:GNAT family N-acetyltransferase [Chloroflexota bacterium]